MRSKDHCSPKYDVYCSGKGSSHSHGTPVDVVATTAGIPSTLNPLPRYYREFQSQYRYHVTLYRWPESLNPSTVLAHFGIPVILNRLVISHAHLTHSYLLNKEQPPNCNYSKSLLTVEHILTSCSAYKNIREKHYSNSQLPHILTNISKHHIF